jgi:ubiquinone/menaquinone biosynthesis C-methylase UbiE
MNEELSKSVAAQLRQPHGEYALQIAQRMNESNLHMNMFTIEALHLKANDKILEIGMGNGFFVKDIFAANNSVKYTGCDFSEAMIEEASKINEKYIQSGQAQFHLSNVDKLPVHDELFDKVFTVNTLYFWSDATTVLNEIRRILKPSGQLIISIRPKSIMEKYSFTKYGFNLFSKEDVVKLLGKNNFKVTDVIEKKEPDQEIEGQKLALETLIVVAEK